MISLAATEAPDKSLLPGDARLLLVYFLKEAELNISLFECTSATYVELPKRMCQGPRGSEMVALCNTVLEVERAPRGEQDPCPPLFGTLPAPLSKSCLLSGLHLLRL